MQTGGRPTGLLRLASWAGFGLGRDNALMFWAVGLNEGAVGAYIALWPLYLSALGASPVEIGLVIGLGGTVYLIAVALGGRLADRVSSRWLLTGTRVLVVVGLLWASLAQEWWLVIPGRLLSSFSGMAWPVAAKVIAANVATERERLRAFTLIYTVGPSAAFLLTPALGGQLAEQTTIRAVLWFATALLVLATLGFAAIRPLQAAPADEAPASYRQALALSAVRRLALLTLATGVTTQMAASFLPKLLRDVHLLGVGSIGLLDSVRALGGILIGLVIGRLLRDVKPLGSIGLALLMYGVGLGGLLLADSFLWLVPAYLLLGGGGLVFSSFYAAMGDAAPLAVRARAFALVELGIGVGASVGPLVAGTLYGHEPRAPLVAATLACLALLATIAWLSRTTPPPGAEPER